MVRPNLRNERIGTVRKNNNGSDMEIIRYDNTSHIWVQFTKGSPVHASWNDFLNGKVTSPYDKTAFGVEYMGEGNYKGAINGIHTEQYKIWHSMLKRCYDEKYKEKRPTYKECKVAEEWHNFQNFAKWYDGNYYEIEEERMNLDKDILVKGNKIYSPDTCVFVPHRINSLFVKSDAIRGKYPIGVTFNKLYNNYPVKLKIGHGKVRHIGVYNNIEEAFLDYKINKEKYIKEVAEDYKDKIPFNLYEAMQKYIVEITD
jgi:hypothetical protein